LHSETREAQAARAERLRELHAGPDALVLPNVWDAATARVIAAAGFPAIATTSSGVAAALGYRDGEGTPAQEMLAAVARIAGAVSVPVTADLESGYGLSPADLVDGLLATGAVGLNLEDSDHRGAEPLIDAGAQAERIAAVRAAARVRGVDIVINARVDVHVRQVGPPESRLEEALRRARLYRQAGADCVFPILVDDEATIAAMVARAGAPVNILAIPSAPPVPRLIELGVRRVSFGGGLHRALMSRLQELADEIRTARQASR
jgi:2-methylisocitrate lyase-like PEP mutase family enzyme